MSIGAAPFALEDLGHSKLAGRTRRLGMPFTAGGEVWFAATMPVDGQTRQPMGLRHGGASRASRARRAAWFRSPDPRAPAGGYTARPTRGGPMRTLKLASVAALALCAGCGQKGPLVLPQKSVATPVLTRAPAAETAAPLPPTPPAATPTDAKPPAERKDAEPESSPPKQ